jgi:hypothetical protein
LSNSANRWTVGADATAETGSNAGSDYVIARFNDAGTQIDVPVLITRSTGIVTFTQPPQPPSFLVAALPAITTNQVGCLAFALNGRNTGEGASAGTGCLCQVQIKSGVATWCAIWSGIAVTS